MAPVRRAPAAMGKRPAGPKSSLPPKRQGGRVRAWGGLKPQTQPRRELRRCTSNVSDSAGSSASTAASFSSEAERREAAAKVTCGVTHQLGLVGGEDYDSKEQRLAQLFERLPVDGAATVVFVSSPASAAAARAVIAASQHPHVSVVAVAGRAASSCTLPTGCQFVINYDIPTTGREYLRRLTALASHLPEHAARLSYTFLDEQELKLRPCRELVGLMKRAKKAAAADRSLGGAAKVAEFESALGMIADEEEAEEEEEKEEEEEGGNDDWACDCQHCRGCVFGSMSHHHQSAAGRICGSAPDVEVVRLPLRALEDINAAAPFIAPRCSHYACTVICLHMLYCHTPWDGWEHLFANPNLGGTVRVIYLLADDCSWHDYPDHATLGGGGVSFSDILDVDMMQRSDDLLGKLVDHEAQLLGGCSERIVLFGASQGGAQSMLRFLRSKRRLAGWIGAVCHAPTAPHTQRARDPLLEEGRPLVNCDRPMRLLAGESDCVFPPGLVLRDAARLREVGGFSDVHVEVQQGLRHDGWDEEPKSEVSNELQALQDVPELLFLRRHLPSLLESANGTHTPPERSESPEMC